MPTLIAEDTFETGGTWNGSAGSPTIVTTPVPVSSTRSLECNAIGEYVYWNIPDSGYTRCVFGVWVRWDTFPTSTTTRVFKIDSGPCEGWMRQDNSGNANIIGDGTPGIGVTYLGQNLVVDTWYWCQIMFDVSANPWEIRGKVDNYTVISNTGAATATNLNPGNFLLGNTSGGEALTVYYSHAKMGVATDDNDWWTAPTGVTLDTCLPDADVTTTGWTTAPLYSKINDSSDATVIQATAS